MGRRVLGQVVPLGVGIVVGSFAATFLGLVGGLVFGCAAWVGTALLLARVRRHRTWRRVYRVLLVAHVLFWSWQGVTHSVPAPSPSGPELGRVVRGASASSYRAGVGEAAFDLPPETTLAGWGGAPRRKAWPAFGGLGVVGRASLAVAGPLFVRPDGHDQRLGARALVLVPEAPDEGPALAIVRLDLIALDPGLQDAVLARLEGVSLTRATLLLAATHTHTGPGGTVRARVSVVAGTDHFDARVFAAVADAAAAAIEGAFRRARPARVAFFQSRDRGQDGQPVLAQNRSTEDDRIDDRVLGLRVDARDEGGTLAVLVNYAVQPVLLRNHHRRFARDVPGAVEGALASALPDRPLVLFVNGALGDVSPRHTFGNGPDGVRRLGAAFAQAIAADVERAPAFDRLRIAAADVTWDPGSPYTFWGVGSRPHFDQQVVPAAFGTDAPGILASALCLPLNACVWSLGCAEVRVGFTFDGAAGAVVNLEGAAGEAQRRVGAVLLEGWDGGVPSRRLPLVWQGGLATQAVGRHWRAAVEARGLPAPLVFALTNDQTAYVTTPQEYEQGGYEAFASLLGRDGALGLERALDLAIAALLEGG